MRRSRFNSQVLQFRQLVTRHSFNLIWVWAGAMFLGLGTVYYKQKQGERVGYSKDDLQPDEEFSMKMHGWIKKLGLDQTVDKPKR